MTQGGIKYRRGACRMVKSFALLLFMPVISAAIAMITLAVPGHAATVVNSFDVCSALRSGASLASVEVALEDRGYSALNAGTFTGTTIRKLCPDQAARVVARLKVLNGR